MFQNIFRIFILTLFGISIATAAVTLQYSEEGVLRQDGTCNIMFVNLGGEKTISNQSYKKSIDKVNNTFNITLPGLINGNIGLNNDTQFDSAVDLPKYVKITQNDQEITTVQYSNFGKGDGKFDLLIYNLVTCDGLKIKQTFKDELVSVANRLYYVNVVPESINQAFDSNLFGPSYSYPFERIHWKINEGLEDLRKTCGIHMLYKGFSKPNGITHHWQYYLSSESINTENCSVREFFEVIKRNYIDYHYTAELLGENYMGYVFKREGHVEVHMDGIIADNHYLIEVYQNKCNDQSEPRTSCTIRSDEKLSFLEFTKRMIHDCMSETINENELIEWQIKNGKATGKLNNQIIEISKGDNVKGKLPSNVDGEIEYYSTATANATPIARFIVTLKCGDGTFPNEICQCQACANHCTKCTSATTCLECEDDESIMMVEELSICIGKKGFYENPVDNKFEPCKKECDQCNSFESCTVCKDSNAVLSDGVCTCPFSFMKDDGNCFVCDSSCSFCDEHGCLACTDESKVPENGKCN